MTQDTTSSRKTFTDWKLAKDMGWPGEQFQFVGKMWDIDLAKETLLDAPRESQMVPITTLVDWVPPDNGKINLLQVYVNWNKAKADETVDPDVPLIFGMMKSVNGEYVVLLFDGHHRLARAIHEEREAMPCVILSKAESDFALME